MRPLRLMKMMMAMMVMSGDGYDLDSLLKYKFAYAPTKVDEDDLDEADDSDEEYGNALLKCYFALVPSGCSQ